MILKRIFFYSFLILFVSSCKAQGVDELIKRQEVQRIIKTLSDDSMQGRAVFTPGIEKAASFIESEFKSAGLQYFGGAESFRQPLTLIRIKGKEAKVIVNGSAISSDCIIVMSDSAQLKWNTASSIEIVKITGEKQLLKQYKNILAMNKPVLVCVGKGNQEDFKRLRDHFLPGRMITQANYSKNAIFILEPGDVKSFEVTASNTVENLSTDNIIGVLPGKSNPEEFVIFSGHYDHLGIIETVKGDSIANGADDDASGITAVITLAKYFKALNNNERSLIFAAFTAEEIGLKGSQYFSTTINPDQVAAMFNIEMIGKKSKFGPNSAFITGYERSDFGQILQKNLNGSKFKFYPDPYTEQQLFYRSDNASLAAMGVPAHTISTDMIDVDPYYHTVDDEFETLDAGVLLSTIKAIAISSKTIVEGKDTPIRIPKLEEK